MFALRYPFSTHLLNGLADLVEVVFAEVLLRDDVDGLATLVQGHVEVWQHVLWQDVAHIFDCHI